MKKILFSLLTLVLGLVLSGSNCSGPDPLPQVPVISNLTVTDVTGVVATLKFDLNVDATVYMFATVVPGSEPSVATIKSGLASSISAGKGIIKNFTGGLVNTPHTLFMVAENAEGISSIVKITFTTKM